MKISALIGLGGMIALTWLGSCSKSPDPAASTTAVMPQANYTTYTGAYTYTDATGRVVADDKASATVTDKGTNSIEIRFSASGSPTVSFTVQKNTGGDYANVDFSQQKGISFKDKSLDVGVSSTSPIYALSFSGSR